MLGIYITAGYPNAELSLQALKALNESEVDLIELGVPFSDPLADGPVIQKASFDALQQGMNLDKVFDLVLKAKDQASKQLDRKGLDNLILFSYYNPLSIYGFDRLISRCKESGVRGLLIPDLPTEEAEELSEKLAAQNLDLIMLIALTSTDERIEKIAKLSHPWIYLVSRIGVTGSNEDIKNLQTTNTNNDKLLSIIKKLDRLVQSR